MVQEAPQVRSVMAQETAQVVNGRTLWLGDCLDLLPRVADGCVDLVYLDPPFNSQAEYNHNFPDRDVQNDGTGEGFSDIWGMDERARKTLTELQNGMYPGLEKFPLALECLRVPKSTQAYLLFMAPRLWHLHRVLKPDGVLWLHCDPTASHYLKVLFDSLLADSPGGFLSDVIWRRHGSHNNALRPGPVHDNLLFFAKGENYTWKGPKTERTPLELETVYNLRDARGRTYTTFAATAAGVRAGESGREWGGYNPSNTGSGRHWQTPAWLIQQCGGDPKAMTVPEKLALLHQHERLTNVGTGRAIRYIQYREEDKGIPLPDIWDDIDAEPSERQYPTQKPLRLLERIIQSSCPNRGVVLDPMMGGGTTLAAAERLGRQWLGMDKNVLSFIKTKDRVRGLLKNLDLVRTDGIPGCAEDMRTLIEENKRQGKNDKAFRDTLADYLILLLPGGRPNPKKSGDGGVDGWMDYTDTFDRVSRKSLVQVKTVTAGRSVVEDLAGCAVKEAKGLDFTAVLIADGFSEAAVTAATEHGKWESLRGEIPRVQLVTIDRLLKKGPRAVICPGDQKQLGRTRDESVRAIPIIDMPETPVEKKRLADDARENREVTAKLETAAEKNAKNAEEQGEDLQPFEELGMLSRETAA